MVPVLGVLRGAEQLASRERPPGAVLGGLRGTIESLPGADAGIETLSSVRRIGLWSAVVAGALITLVLLLGLLNSTRLL